MSKIFTAKGAKDAKHINSNSVSFTLSVLIIGLEYVAYSMGGRIGFISVEVIYVFLYIELFEQLLKW